MNKIIKLIVWCLLLTLKALSQTPDKTLSFPLGSFSLDSNLTWLSKIFDKQITTDISIVGLGEFTHGGHETAQFKSKMIQYLVENKGFRHLFIEYPNVKFIPLIEYLQRKDAVNLDSVRHTVQEAFGRRLRDENLIKALIWVKQFNLKHPNDMVAVNGFDIEGASDGFADYFIYNYLLPLDHKSALEIQSKYFQSPDDTITSAELKWYYKNKELINKKVSKYSLESLLYNIKNAEDKISHTALEKKDIFKASAFRDSMMANNILNSGNSKAIVWAHNIHILTATKASVLGNYLKREIGNKYYNILTDFSTEANLWIIDNNSFLQNRKYISNEKSTASIMKQKFKINEGVVLFNTLIENNIDSIVNDIGINGDKRIVYGGKVFDALVFFYVVTPSIPGNP